MVQDETVSRIVSAFDSKKWVMLCAQMQSGKTGIYTKVAETMGMKTYVISALGDNYLRDQTKDRIHHVANVLFLPALIRKVKEGSMASLVTEFHGSLIIIDESHVGARHGGILHRFLSMLGISPDGHVDEGLYPDGGVPLVLSVSATPYSEIRYASDLKEVIIHHPGEGYCGLDKMKLVHDGDLAEAISKVRDTKTYAIIRDTCPDLPLLDVIMGLGVPVVHCNMETKVSVSEAVEQEPAEFTIVMIKMYSRCGYTFSKRYISMVWECIRSPAGQAQGLPGRCCGYDPSGMDVIIHCDSSIRDHMEWVTSGYLPSMAPSSGPTSMYEVPSLEIDDTLVLHAHEMDDDDVIPLIYGSSGLVITSEGDDVEAAIDEVTNFILITGRWGFYLSPSYDHLYPFIEDRLDLDLPMYTPSNQEEVADLLLERLVPIVASELEDDPVIMYCWPYERSMLDYIANTTSSRFMVNCDGVVVYRLPV